MKKCKNCNLLINNEHKFCLFCDSELILIEDDSSLVQLFPKVKSERHPSKIIKKIILFSVFSFLIVFSLLNYVYFKNSQSLYIVLVSCLYLFLASFAIMDFSKSWIFRISLVIFYTTALTVLIGFLLDNYDWSLNYVLPFAFMGNALFSTIVLMIKNKRWHSYVIYLLMTLVLGIIPLPLALFNLIDIAWPALVCSLYCLLTVLGLWLFSPKNLKEELFRRFHV